MTADEMEKIRKIIKDEMRDMKTDIDEKFARIFESLDDKVNTRVSDTSCQTHRQEQGERLEVLGNRLTVIETIYKIIGGAMAVIIPLILVGAVYMITNYQKVQDLDDKIKTPTRVEALDK